MRIVWLMPVTYIAGIEGFGWFVPYLLFLCVIATVVRIKRQRVQRTAPVPRAELPPSLLELEPALA